MVYFTEVSQGSDIQKQVDATLVTEGDRSVSIYAAPVAAESSDETAILLHLVETTEQKRTIHMFNLINGTQGNVKNDILSGVTVAFALVPEAVAFAFVAGVEPMVGLYAAFMMGLITSAIGGRPGMISGATGAMAVVMVALVAQHGVQYPDGLQGCIS